MREIFGEYGLLLLTTVSGLGIAAFVLGGLLGTDGLLKSLLTVFADGLLGG